MRSFSSLSHQHHYHSIFHNDQVCHNRHLAACKILSPGKNLKIAISFVSKILMSKKLSLFVTLLYLYHHYHHPRHLATSNSLSPGTTSLPRLIQHSRRRPRVHEVVAALKVIISIITITLFDKDLLILLKSPSLWSLYFHLIKIFSLSPVCWWPVCNIWGMVVQIVQIDTWISLSCYIDL